MAGSGPWVNTKAPKPKQPVSIYEIILEQLQQTQKVVEQVNQHTEQLLSLNATQNASDGDTDADALPQQQSHRNPDSESSDQGLLDREGVDLSQPVLEQLKADLKRELMAEIQPLLEALQKAVQHHGGLSDNALLGQLASRMDARIALRRSQLATKHNPIGEPHDGNQDLGHSKNG